MKKLDTDKFKSYWRAKQKRPEGYILARKKNILIYKPR